MSKLPKVKLIVAGNQKILEQEYQNLVIVQNNGGLNIPEFFNNESSDGCIKGYFSPYDNFNTEKSLEIIVDALLNTGYIGAVYSDTILDDGFLQPQYMINYQTKDSEYDCIVNVPIFCRGVNKVASFDTNLQHLYLFDFLRKICSSTIVSHIPEPLITTIPPTFEDVSNDMNIIYKKNIKGV